MAKDKLRVVVLHVIVDLDAVADTSERNVQRSLTE
jgi:hypothetical protein